MEEIIEKWSLLSEDEKQEVIEALEQKLTDNTKI